MIRDHLIPALRTAFPTGGFMIRENENPFASLNSPCADVGTLSIYDDGDEATVAITEFSHSHFRYDDASLSLKERELHVAEDVVDFVRALLADQGLLFRYGG